MEQFAKKTNFLTLNVVRTSISAAPVGAVVRSEAHWFYALPLVLSFLSHDYSPLLLTYRAAFAGEAFKEGAASKKQVSGKSKASKDALADFGESEEAPLASKKGAKKGKSTLERSANSAAAAKANPVKGMRSADADVPRKGQNNGAQSQGAGRNAMAFDDDSDGMPCRALFSDETFGVSTSFCPLPPSPFGTSLGPLPPFPCGIIRPPPPPLPPPYRKRSCICSH